MQRLRLIDVKAMVGRVVGLCADSAELLDLINRAQQRLLESGHYVGTYVRYKVCLNESCFTLPREMESIDAAALCDVPLTVRGDSYEFMSSGPGILDEDDDIGNQIADDGEAAGFDVVRGTDKKLAVYADQAESSAVINLQYRDSNGQWVRTSYGGSFIDGENITVTSSGTYQYTSSDLMPGGFIRAYKPVTNGVIRIYEYDTTSGDYRPLAYYAPDETTPVYRRYKIPNLGNLAASNSCAYHTVVIQGKLRFQKAFVDNDFLMISQPDAIRLMAQAIKKEENNLLGGDAALYAAQALEVLDRQLGHYKGIGEVQPIVWEAEVTGPGVLNLQ